MLYQQVRPKTFDEMVGNKAVIQGLKGLVTKKPADRPHAYLLHGPSGCGKTTLARIIAKEFGCDDINVFEINTANSRGIETIRDISNSADLMPMFGAAKAYILDESHQLTPAAQEALLKVIEDCPGHVYFIFCTTDPSKIITTIRNRCAKYEVSPLRPSELRKVMENVLDATSTPAVNAPPQEVVDAIVKASNSCPRQAVMLWEQISTCTSVEEALEAIEYLSTAESVSKEIFEIVQLVSTRKANRWERIAKAFRELKPDPEKVRLSIMGYCKTVLLTTEDLEEAGRMAELISIFEKPVYTAGEAVLARMLFESTLLE